MKQDELIANIETDKVTIPVNSPESGMLKDVFAKVGDTIEVGSDLFKLDTDAKAPTEKPKVESSSPKAPESQPVKPTQPDRQPLKEAAPTPAAPAAVKGETPMTQAVAQVPVSGRVETREKMTRMRIRISERMKEAQNTAASLTTFNEVDMSALANLRSQFKDDFVKKHGVKLGYMSAFVKACAQVLQEIPIVNARIDPATNEIVYSNFVDISVAVATPKGLVTPVLRNCEQKSFAQIERNIADYGAKAREGRIALEDLAGGTFTISNGGVFGSLMGTPILNSPQTAILGMHAIKDRPVVVNGKIEIRPMMYLAFTYDHRLVDGREAVTFLVRIKELLENPNRFLLEL